MPLWLLSFGTVLAMVKIYDIEPKRCIDCRKEFKPGSNSQIRCYACASLKRSDYLKTYYQKLKDAHLCPLCKAPLPEGYTKVTCSNCREIQNAKHRVKYEEIIKPIKKCKECGKEFTSCYSHKIYCSSECREKNKRRLNAIRNRQRTKEKKSNSKW